MLTPTDKSLLSAVKAKIDNLNKPKGSLGRLESLATQIALIQQTLTPRLCHPCHILFGGDHGIEREGVSLSPREVTWQQMQNYDRGGGGVNVFCRQHGFRLRIVDVGVDHDFDHERFSHIIDRKIGYGTRNFLHEPAMSEDEWRKALAVGAEQVDECAAEGCNVISFGEMGIGNTSPSSVLMHLFLSIPLERCVGCGSGLDDAGVRHKLEVLRAAVENGSRHLPALISAGTQPTRDDAGAEAQGDGVAAQGTSGGAAQGTYCPAVSAEETVRYYAGYEMAAAIGGMLRAAEHGMTILVDGFIMTACMLAASRMEPAVTDYAVFGHCGDEGGHKLMLDAMGAEPLLSLGLRLGEGTGALIAYPIVESAVAMLNEMDNFSHAEITKYF